MPDQIRFAVALGTRPQRRYSVLLPDNSRREEASRVEASCLPNVTGLWWDDGCSRGRLSERLADGFGLSAGMSCVAVIGVACARLVSRRTKPT